jgi:hypothetical protein
MSDARIADFGRRLAEAWYAWARSRAPDDLKAIAALHTSCAAVREEERTQPDNGERQ